MDRDVVARISRQIAKTFPEVAGVNPTIRRQQAPGNDGEQYLLTFKGKAALPGGRTLSRIVRVVADASGRILRISTSR
jgi:hypothetical protein